MTPEELSERLWRFAARVGKLVDALPDTRLGRHVAGQLVRCGTAPPPNYDESCAAEGRRDFVHKLGNSTQGAAGNPRVAPMTNSQCPMPNEKCRRRKSSPFRLKQQNLTCLPLME